MIHAWVPRDGAVDRLDLQPRQAVPEEAVWLDLFEPDHDERRRVETLLGIELPTHDEMLEIEPSRRLYQDGDATVMTATVITHADAPDPSSDVLTRKPLSSAAWSTCAPRASAIRPARRPCGIEISRLAKPAMGLDFIAPGQS